MENVVFIIAVGLSSILALAAMIMKLVLKPMESFVQPTLSVPAFVAISLLELANHISKMQINRFYARSPLDKNALLQIGARKSQLRNVLS